MILSRFLVRPVSKLLVNTYYKPLNLELQQSQLVKQFQYSSSTFNKGPGEEKLEDGGKIGEEPLTSKVADYVLTETTATAATTLAAADAKGMSKGSGTANSPPPLRQGLKRSTYSGKCRWGFIPEEFFTFFYPLTGVSGPYLFILGITNFILSKEIYVLEHEYYSGLSILVMALYIVKAFGKSIGASLDKQVDSVVAEMNKTREDEIKDNQNDIKECTDLQLRAKAQKLLIDAKKENVAMQLEAIYRERAMILYQRVKGRMDYHVMKHKAESRIQQKWMLEWILEQVRNSITPEFEKKALVSALNDLASAADRFKKK